MRQFSRHINKKSRRIVEVILVDRANVFFIPSPSIHNFINKGKSLTHNQFSTLYEPLVKGNHRV